MKLLRKNSQKFQKIYKKILKNPQTLEKLNFICHDIEIFSRTFQENAVGTQFNVFAGGERIHFFLQDPQPFFTRNVVTFEMKMELLHRFCKELTEGPFGIGSAASQDNVAAFVNDPVNCRRYDDLLKFWGFIKKQVNIFLKKTSVKK